MSNLFVYGSLMYEPVWQRLVAGDFERRPARLQGYRRLRIRNEDYPGLVKGDGTVAGIVWLGVDSESLARLDEFEGDPYQRVSGLVVDDGGGEIVADFYEIRDSHRHIVQDDEWDVREFERDGLARFLGRYEGFVDPQRR